MIHAVGQCKYIRLHSASSDPVSFFCEGQNFIFLLSGAAEVRTQSTSQTLNRGTAAIFFSGHVAAVSADFFILPIAQELLCGCTFRICVVSGEDYGPLIVTLTRMVDWPDADIGAGEPLENLWRHLNGTERTQTDSIIQRSIEWIHANLHRTFEIREMAAEFGYDVSYFCRMFHRNTGKTIKEYQNELRMQEACMLLSDTQRTVNSIAMELGYSSDKHFMSTFKKYKRITPCQYRYSVQKVECQ